MSKHSVLLVFTFPGHLAGETMLFLWLFAFTHWGFHIGSFFSSKYRVYKANRKSRGSHHHDFPLILRFLALLYPSLHLSESSYVCFTYNIQGFKFYLAGKIGKKYPTFSEAEIPSALKKIPFQVQSNLRNCGCSIE